MRLIELLPERVRVHAKAVVAMVVPAVLSYFAVRGNGVTLSEWVTIVGLALGAGGFVDMIPNRLTLDQVNRFFDQVEDQYGGKFEWVDAEIEAELRFGDRVSQDAQDLPDNPRDDEPPDESGKHRRE